MDINTENIIGAGILTFRPTWELFTLIVAIERFDALWPQIMNRESSILTVNSGKFKYQTPREVLMIALQSCETEIKISISERFEQMMFWCETELTIPALLRCILLAYWFQDLIQFEGFEDSFIIKVIVYNLLMAGYSWASHIDIGNISSLGTNIYEWVYTILATLRDGQQLLLRKIDCCGAANNLTTAERLLIHIINTNVGITTSKIARKLGKSETTVRRMLAKLRKMNLIQASGSGPKLYHNLIAPLQ